jgi:lysozyme
MQPRQRASRAAIELIKRFEGYRRAAAQLPDGRWTIGHGHTLTARQGAEVSENDAEALLLYDLIAIAHGLNEAVYTPLTQNQFDALASFAFNLGLDNFHQSGVLKRLNEGAHLQAACGMELWRKANIGGERIVVDALVRRRAAEKALFLTPPGEAWVPAPSPILRPLLDADLSGVVPAQKPIEVTAVLEGDQLVVHREDTPAPSPVAPDDDDEALGPASAAAEAVSARLSTIFQEPGEEPPAEPRPEPEPNPYEPGRIRFQRPAFEDPVPFFLRAPEPGSEPAETDTEAEPHEAWEEGPQSRDLFALESVDDDAHAEDDDAGYEPAGETLGRDRDRHIIDDSVPYDFVPPTVRPLPDRPESGLLTLMALAVLGLVFFGGGIFWATNARPITGAHLLGPRMVGGLAGIAGVGFFVVAVYLLLERLGRASERQARHRP